MGTQSLMSVWPCSTMVMRAVQTDGKINLQYEIPSVVGGLCPCALSHLISVQMGTFQMMRWVSVI